MEITTKQKKTLVLKTGFMFFMQNIISFFPFDFGVKCDLDMVFYKISPFYDIISQQCAKWKCLDVSFS